MSSSTCWKATVDRTVGDRDIDDWLSVGTIRRKIRDEFIADATVTIVLIGKCTWQQKYVDWKIGSSLRDAEYNSRVTIIENFVSYAAVQKLVDVKPD